MRKYIIFCLLPLFFLGCKVRVEGPYNESVDLSLPQKHKADIRFSREKGNIYANVFLNKKGVDTYRAAYIGGVKWQGEKTSYVFTLEQRTDYMDKLSKKDRAYYTDPKPIKMEVQYTAKNHAYSIRFSGSKCPALQMPNAKSTVNETWEEIEEEADDGSFWTKVKHAIGKSCAFIYNGIQNSFDRVFGSWDFSSHWWFLFYVGGLLIIAIGLKLFTPICWIGVIMQYAYLMYVSPPFYMLWPSIVGWGWMIVSLIPVVIIICMNAVLLVSLILSSFVNGFVNFLIMFIPVVISILSLIALVNIAFTDHIELIVFFIIGALGGGKRFVGTFIDANGNVWNVYR